MSKNSLLWLLGGGVFLIAITVFVTVIVITPEQEELESKERVGIREETRSEREARQAACKIVQDKIDDEGQPGWDGLSDGLRAEIEELQNQCTFLGDEKRY